MHPGSLFWEGHGLIRPIKQEAGAKGGGAALLPLHLPSALPVTVLLHELDLSFFFFLNETQSPSLLEKDISCAKISCAFPENIE